MQLIVVPLLLRKNAPLIDISRRHKCVCVCVSQSVSNLLLTDDTGCIVSKNPILQKIFIIIPGDNSISIELFSAMF